MSRDVVCVVYGQDEDAREAVARVLDMLGLASVFLHIQADAQGPVIGMEELPPGETAYTIVLLTPDDVGSRQGETARPRAQQSVVLALGYFLGKVGRERVCVLVKGDVEIPSSLYGVRYMPMDDEGTWRLRLAYELKEAGLPVDVYGLIA
jgi:predicted nucleotide-binding protein